MRDKITCLVILANITFASFFAITDKPCLGITSSKTSTSASATNSTETAATPVPTQQLQVQKVELSLEKLRDVGLDLKQVLKSAHNLYDEVTIQPVTLITEPEVIDGGLVINIPVGTMPVGVRQPPRKARVDAAMAGIRPIVETLKANVDDFLAGNRQLNLPNDIKTELQPQFKEWIAMVNDMFTQLTQLEQLTQGAPYDNDAIATVTQGMQKDVQELDKTRRSIYKVIRKEGKRLASSHSPGS